MRVMLKAEIPVEAGNEVVASGRLAEVMQSILGELKPEATYFLASNGKRTGLLFIDLADASEIPAVAEPWFQAFNADIEIVPVMIPEDLMKAGEAIGAAAAKYG